MKAYRTFQTVSDSKEVVLADIPFEPGQRVEILVLAQEQAESEGPNALDALLAATQSLPQLRKLSDEEIAAEIEGYRSGR